MLMDIKTFTQKSQKQLSSILNRSSFDLVDTTKFGKIGEPVSLNSNNYSPYFFKLLTGYRVDKKSTLDVKYTFFVLQPANSLKKKFLNTLVSKESGKDFDEEIISKYYEPFVPTNAEFSQLISDLEGLLEQVIYKGRGYKFMFNLVVPTADYDFALAFLEEKSVNEAFEELKD
jgi:hypothetical protein